MPTLPTFRFSPGSPFLLLILFTLMGAHLYTWKEINKYVLGLINQQQTREQISIALFRNLVV
jgi:hypothetical protein